MIAFSSDKVKKRLISLLEKYNLPTEISFDSDELLKALRHDKKAESNGVNVVFVDDIGSFQFGFLRYNELEEKVKGAYVK